MGSIFKFKLGERIKNTFELGQSVGIDEHCAIIGVDDRAQESVLNSSYYDKKNVIVDVLGSIDSVTKDFNRVYNPYEVDTVEVIQGYQEDIYVLVKQVSLSMSVTLDDYNLHRTEKVKRRVLIISTLHCQERVDLTDERMHALLSDICKLGKLAGFHMLLMCSINDWEMLPGYVKELFGLQITSTSGRYRVTSARGGELLAFE